MPDYELRGPVLPRLGYSVVPPGRENWAIAQRTRRLAETKQTRRRIQHHSEEGKGRGHNYIGHNYFSNTVRKAKA